MLNQELFSILSPAYAPCEEFSNSCTEMRWKPEAGHIPRGYLGAAGNLEEVELVLVFAEPGDPHDGEQHTGINTAYEYATFAFRNGKDLFHRNVRKILDMCWPQLSFEEQLHKVWLTESVLCSARAEGGAVSTRASVACGKRFLLAQLACFPNALVVALGHKAQNRLKKLGVTSFHSAAAVAPPGCNRLESKRSWEQIPAELERRRRLVRQHRSGIASRLSRKR